MYILLKFTPPSKKVIIMSALSLAISNAIAQSSAINVHDFMSQSKFFESYSRFLPDLGRYETWSEAVARVMDMHRQKYAHVMTPELNELMQFAHEAYEEKLVLGSQRALQFGGAQIFKHEAKMYNCSFGHCSRTRFFQEAMYLLLCGCGVGFSVQKHHIAKLPKISRPANGAAVFTIPDSIEGWSDALGVLMSSYFVSDAPFPEYAGKAVLFDYSEIRPRGALISGGFTAPGPEGLETAIEAIRKLIEQQIKANGNPAPLRPIVAYDIVMHMSNAVISGGVRRSATLCLFSKDDDEMMSAKTGDWGTTNPQRARSNNSVALLRDELTREEWAKIVEKVKQFGEPGFIFCDSLEHGFNPCVEIGMLPYTTSGESGFQFCNLCEINGIKIVTRELFLRAARAAAILGTLQAGYTNFTYVSDATREITEREALLGVSITGWMNNPEALFDEEFLRAAAKMVKETNKQVAELIGIRQAARTTCVKPSGNASTLLGCASGIHGEHSPRHFRHAQFNMDTPVAKAIMAHNPAMVEKSVWSTSGTDIVVAFPVVTKEGSIYKDSLMGVKQLEFVKRAQLLWVNEGKNPDLCTDDRLSHNVSNTISVDDWDQVEDYIYQNRHFFAGISLMAAYGDKAYVQAPFTDVPTPEVIQQKYGVASMFASGLIVDGNHAFDNNLWQACDTLLGFGLKLSEDNSGDLLKRDWIRRAHKFAHNYFGGDLMTMTFCLKDVYNLHKWETIQLKMVPMDYIELLKDERLVSADTMGAVGCSGNNCEVSF
jgi:ribonucleoside-triphosphate reductase